MLRANSLPLHPTNAVFVSDFLKASCRGRSGPAGLRNKLRFLEFHLGLNFSCQASDLYPFAVASRMTQLPVPTLTRSHPETCLLCGDGFARVVLAMCLGSVRFRHLRRMRLVELRKDGLVFQAYSPRLRRSRAGLFPGLRRALLFTRANSILRSAWKRIASVWFLSWPTCCQPLGHEFCWQAYVAVAKALQPLNHLLHRQMSRRVRSIAGRFNVAFWLWCQTVLNWPDVSLSWRLIKGFDIVGEVKVTHVLRPCEPPTSATSVLELYQSSVALAKSARPSQNPVLDEKLLELLQKDIDKGPAEKFCTRAGMDKRFG